MTPRASVSTKKASKNSSMSTRSWYVIDAKDMVLGRCASKVAYLLQGKHKVSYLPNADGGDHVVVINAAGIRVTGKKEQTKMYYWHTKHLGGIQHRNFRELMEQDPAIVIHKAVINMLPKNRLRASMIKRLHISSDEKHPHNNVNLLHVD